jgi:hypothetical protein
LGFRVDGFGCFGVRCCGFGVQDQGLGFRVSG